MTLTLLGGLMKAKTIRNALVLCPVSLLRTWENEARKVLITYLGLPSITISVISSEMDRHKRAYMLEKAMTCSKKRPHLIISTYGLLTSNPSDLAPQKNNDYSSWNYVILDEGHKVRFFNGSIYPHGFSSSFLLQQNFKLCHQKW
jgi:SNF2 family DNA or RNA helicase